MIAANEPTLKAIAAQVWRAVVYDLSWAWFLLINRRRPYFFNLEDAGCGMILGRAGLHYFEYIDGSEANIDAVEFYAWLRDNGLRLGRPSVSGSARAILFRNADQALLFKLRWL